MNDSCSDRCKNDSENLGDIGGRQALSDPGAGNAIATRGVGLSPAARRLTQPASTGLALRRRAGDRIDWIDYAKGIGIILVVLGHVLYGMSHAALPLPPHFSYLLDWIYSFHMPLFFFLSGLFFTPAIETGIRRVMCRRMGTILYCYLLWSLLNLLGRHAFSRYLNYPVGWPALSSFWTHPLGELWFLYALLWCNAVFAVCYALRLPPLGMLLVGSGALLLGVALAWGPGDIVDRVLYHSFFFALGISVARLRSATWSNVYFTVPLSIVCFTVMSAAVLAGMHWGHFRVAVALMGILGTIFLAQALPNISFCGVIRRLGVLSLQIYLTHDFFAAGWRIVCQKGLGIEDVTWHLIGGLAAGLCLPVALQWLTVRFRFPYLFSPPRLVPYQRCESNAVK